MVDGAEYRARAAEFLDLAQRASDAELTMIYRQLAFQYERLFDWMEQRRDWPEPQQSSPDWTAPRH